MTIPGAGLRTANAMVASLGDPQRFRNSKAMGCYIGLVRHKTRPDLPTIQHRTSVGDMSIWAMRCQQDIAGRIVVPMVRGA